MSDDPTDPIPFPVVDMAARREEVTTLGPVDFAIDGGYAPVELTPLADDFDAW